jgi:hypothetical protein
MDRRKKPSNLAKLGSTAVAHKFDPRQFAEMCAR